MTLLSRNGIGGKGGFLAWGHSPRLRERARPRANVGGGILTVVNDIKPAAEIVRDLVRDAEVALARAGSSNAVASRVAVSKEGDVRGRKGRRDE